MFRLDDRVAFISGAAGHLGRSMATALAKAGAKVYLNGRDAARLESLARELCQQGMSAVAAPFDVSDPKVMLSFFETLLAREGRLNVLVNNAYSGVVGTIDTVQREEYARAFEMAATSAMDSVRAALPALKAAVASVGDASVINIASMYGTVSPDPRIYGDGIENNPPHYGAAKAALIQLTRYTACHLAPHGIRVNAISPGPFPSPATVKQSKKFHANLCEKVPLGRTGNPAELAGPLLFLASDASTYVTGINLPVDGGWTAW